jgi:hypothetical protein
MITAIEARHLSNNGAADKLKLEVIERNIKCAAMIGETEIVEFDLSDNVQNALKDNGFKVEKNNKGLREVTIGYTISW